MISTLLHFPSQKTNKRFEVTLPVRLLPFVVLALSGCGNQDPANTISNSFGSNYAKDFVISVRLENDDLQWSANGSDMDEMDLATKLKAYADNIKDLRRLGKAKKQDGTDAHVVFRAGPISSVICFSIVCKQMELMMMDVIKIELVAEGFTRTALFEIESASACADLATRSPLLTFTNHTSDGINLTSTLVGNIHGRDESYEIATLKYRGFFDRGKNETGYTASLGALSKRYSELFTQVCKNAQLDNIPVHATFSETSWGLFFIVYEALNKADFQMPSVCFEFED